MKLGGGKNSGAKQEAAGSKSGEDRAARATRRMLAKEAQDAEQPRLKKARLDASSDLVSLLTTSAGVSHIFAASGSKPLPEEAVAMDRASAKVQSTNFAKLCDQHLTKGGLGGQA